MTTRPTTSRLVSEVTAGDDMPSLVYPVTATTVVLGAMATRDWRPMHHDATFAVERQGVRGIFLNTPNQAAWFERYVTDWTGPKGRLGRMTFRMKDSVFAGDVMTITGTVRDVAVDASDCAWVTADLRMTVGERLCTTCEARVAVPVDENDNPWSRRGERWLP